MKLLPLTNSTQFVFVSDEDYEIDSQHTWFVKESAYCSYICRSVRTESHVKTTRLHCVIYERMTKKPIPERIEVHHKNGNTFDCMRDNLEGLTKKYHCSLTRKNGRKIMKTFRILETVVHAYAYNIQAENGEEAVGKIEQSLGAETEDIVHLPEYDEIISRDYQCEGEQK